MNHRWRHEEGLAPWTSTLSTITRGLAHQSSELARCFGKSPRNLMPRSEPFGPNRLRLECQEEGGTTGGMECGALLLCCCAVLHCCVVTVVAPSSSNNTELCCAALLCCVVLLRFCCGSVSAPSSSYNTELSHRWVDTLSCNPTVTTPSCHPVVRPHSQHRKVALRGTEVVWDLWLKPGQ